MVSGLLDSFGRPISRESKCLPLEDVKSFSFKLNLKKPDGTPAYEDAHFFQSRKFRCLPGDEEAAAREAFEWCFEQVSDDIRVFTERRERKQAARARQSRVA